MRSQFFVGREQQVNTFKECFHNADGGVYYYGRGGIGKSVLLRKLLEVSRDELGVKDSYIFDLFATKYRSIEGLQNTIMKKLGSPEAFSSIYDIDQKLKEAHKKKRDILSYSVGLSSSLYRRKEVLFPFCCNEAAKDRKVVLIFDSFEYVQELDVGKWFLNDFLPFLTSELDTGIIVVLAGRPEPTVASTPSNIITKELEGFRGREVKEYFQHVNLKWAEGNFEAFVRWSQGNPLLIELLSWAGRRDLMTTKLHLLQEILDHPAIMAQEIFTRIGSVKPINFVLWAMATLKRRFTLDMLEYLVDNVGWLGKDKTHEEVWAELHHLPFVKGNESSEQPLSHLLHDLAIEPIRHVFSGIDGFQEFQEQILQTIVYGYYPEMIKSSPRNESLYLQVEQLGYILEQDFSSGKEKYDNYVQEAKQRSDFEFEELLWSEIYKTIQGLSIDKKVNVMMQRVQWLYENSLYEKQETLSRIICETEGIQQETLLQAMQFLGFALMRQGKLMEAEVRFNKALQLAHQIRSGISDTENDLGQLMMSLGKFRLAEEHYWNSIRNFEDFDNPYKLAATYSARGRALGLLGNYNRALSHCNYALQLLDDDVDKRRQVYAFRNIGVVYRLMASHENAERFLTKSVQIARAEKILELEAELFWELGLNYYHKGRQNRIKEENYALEANELARALDASIKILDKGRKIEHRILVRKGLLLLAYIFEEIALLENVKDDIKNTQQEFPQLLIGELSDQAQKMHLVEEEYWQRRGLTYFSKRSLTDLSLAKKAVRTFELAGLEAYETNQVYGVLESLSEITRILLQLKDHETVEGTINKIMMNEEQDKDREAGIISNVEEIIRGISQATDFYTHFTTLTQLLLADLYFDQGNLKAAQKLYINYMPRFIRLKGQLSQLVVDNRVNELFKRIGSMENPNDVKNWCEQLRLEWEGTEASNALSSLTERVEITYHNSMLRSRV
jgi:tetratricopeptide (TPR) repeat protein